MKNYSLNRSLWWFWIYLIRTGGLIFLLSPRKLPAAEKQKLRAAAVQPDVLIIFNPGGWGDATLEEANDFTPILKGMKQTLIRLGYKTAIIQYTRTLASLSGRIAGTKEQLLSFKNSSRIQEQDIRCLLEAFPHKHFILAGFSTGGGLTARTLKGLNGHSNIFGVMVGVPGWFPTLSSEKTLVLDNSGRDPISCGRINTIAVTVFRAPFLWLGSKIKGRDLSLALALQFPDHEYTWSSPEVGAPITKFLETHFQNKPSSK
jgi:hypothetical protein